MAKRDLVGVLLATQQRKSMTIHIGYIESFERLHVMITIRNIRMIAFILESKLDDRFQNFDEISQSIKTVF